MNGMKFILRKRKAAYMQITRHCNNDCVFCSNPKFEEFHSLNHTLSLIDEYFHDGVTEITLTGGEPTTHPAFLEIVSRIVEKGMTPKLITNGITLSEKTFFQKVLASGVNSINLSFHSHIDELSKKIYGKDDVISKQKKALELYGLLNSPIPMNLNLTINSLNYQTLPDLVKFVNKNYPKIRHIVFNFLDPGTPDGINLSSAAKNSWIIVKHCQMERYLKDALDFLESKNITFRVERVPLCYLNGHEHISTETRRIIKKEGYSAFFLRSKDKSEKRNILHYDLRDKTESCQICTLNEVCAGIQKEYLQIYGSSEIYPVFLDKRKIISRVLQ